MKITLHIGLHRTGTTALQGALGRGAGRLRAKGVWFAQTPVVRPAVSDRLIAAERTGPMAGAAQARARATIRAWVQAREDEGVRRLVISDEVILGLMDRSLGEDGIYPGAAARLALLAEALEGWPAQAFAGLRAPASWYPSVYAFALSRRRQGTFETARRAALEAERGLAALARDVDAAFPAPVFWTTDFYRERPGRVHLLLTGKRLARRLKAPRKAVNASLSGPSMARLEALRAQGARVDRDVLRALRREAPARKAGAWDPWTREEREALAARWRGEIAAIRASGLKVMGAGRVLRGPEDEASAGTGDELQDDAYDGAGADPAPGATQGGAT